MADADVIAAKIRSVSVHMPTHQHAFLAKACVLYKDSAQHAIGTYQFGWTPLAASTLARKSADTPLLETGALRDSIEYQVLGPTDADVGTNHYVAAWQEGGTRTIPPRPFMGGALNAMEPQVLKAVEDMLHQFFR